MGRTALLSLSCSLPTFREVLKGVQKSKKEPVNGSLLSSLCWCSNVSPVYNDDVIVYNKSSDLVL